MVALRNTAGSSRPPAQPEAADSTEDRPAITPTATIAGVAARSTSPTWPGASSAASAWLVAISATAAARPRRTSAPTRVTSAARSACHAIRPARRRKRGIWRATAQNVTSPLAISCLAQP